MRLGRRSAHGAELFAVERPPRLVLRFAVVLSVTLALASALILVAVRTITLQQAETAATRQASLVATTLLQRDVEANDFVRPVRGQRRRSSTASSARIWSPPRSWACRS